MHGDGRAALSGALPCLQALRQLELFSLRLQYKPGAKRVEGALAAAIADLPRLAVLRLDSATSERACTACSAHIVSCLHRCRSLRELSAVRFVGDRRLFPPHTSHLTQLTCLRATLVAVHDKNMFVRAAAWLTRHLAHMSALQRLELSQPEERMSEWQEKSCRAATDAAYTALATALAQLQRLTQLKIVRLGVVSRDALSAAHAALGQLQKLQTLHLDGALGSPASSLWAAQVQMTCLADIKLFASSAECAQAVTTGVGLPAELRVSRLASRCGVQNMFAIWADEGTRITGLGQAIASLLKVCTNAVSVTVHAQHVSDEDGYTMAPVLQHMPLAADITLPLVVGSGKRLTEIVRATTAMPCFRSLCVGLSWPHGCVDHLLPNTVWLEAVQIWLAAGVTRFRMCSHVCWDWCHESTLESACKR